MDLFTLTAKLGLDTSDYDTKISDAVTDAQTSGEKIQTALNGKGTGGNTGIGKAADNTTESVNAFGTTVKSILTSQAIQKGISFVTSAGKEAVNAASDLTEVQNVVDQTFGSSANQINRWAEAQAGAYGLSELQAKQYAGYLGSIFQSSGIGQEQSAEMAMNLAGLAGDFASFYNIGINEAYEKIRSGISGTSIEPLQGLGINLSAGNLEEYSGMSLQDMSEMEKIQTRYNYLMDKTMTVQGDYMRTSDEYANSQRTLENNLEKLSVSFGEKLLPVMQAGTNAANSFFDAIYSESADETLTGIDTAAQNTSANIENTAEHARAMVSVLEDYGDKSALTAEQQGQWNTVAGELIRSIPELGGMLDLQTGKIEGGTEALSENIDAWESAGKAAAETSALEEKESMLSDISSDITKEQGLLAIAEKELSNAQTAMIAKAQEAAAATGEAFDGTAQSAIDMLSRYGDYYANFGVDDIENVVSAYEDADESVKTHQNNLTTLQEDYGTVEQSIAEDSAALSETVGTMEGDVTASFGAIETATDTLVSNFDQSDTAYANAYNTGIGAANGLNDAYPEYEAAASQYQFSAPLTGMGTETHGFATGLDYVPYNDYPARLHEGEAVLTKAEATDWRAGNTGGAVINEASLASAIATAVANALDGAFVDMDGERVGNLVTRTVSRNIADGVRSKRYQAVW